MKNNTTLLVIDAQNDFHDITGAALPVPGSVKDTERLSAIIPALNPTNIIASLDTHYILDISHPSWWNDSKGNPVAPFTFISADAVKNGEFTPRVDPVGSLKYLEALQANGEFIHIIWPEHCIQGTPGHALLPVFFEAVSEWSRKNLKWVHFITKGVNPYTEHFGIFRANVPLANDPSSNINQPVIKKLEDSDLVYLAGQARTHCVANSLTQLLSIAPNLASKLVILEDCTSDVAGLPADFYNGIDAIYADAKAKGVQFIKSTDI